MTTKKLVLLVTIVALLGFNITVPVEANINNDETSYIENSGFENEKISPWKEFGIGGKSADVTIDTQECFDGEQSTCINAVGNGVTRLSQRFKGDFPENLTLSAWTKTKGEAWIELIQLRRGKPIRGLPFSKSKHIRKNEGWDGLTVTVKIDDRADELEIHLFCKQGKTWYDKISCVESGKQISSIFSEIINPDLASAGTKLYLSFVCHQEPHKQYSQEKYTRERLEGLDNFTKLLDKFGAKLTLQIQQPFTETLKKLNENPFKELELNGHEVCTHYHENVYVPNHAPRAQRVKALADLKADIDSFGVSNLTLCGGWQQTDIVEIAGEVGYKYLDNYKYAPTQEGSEAGLSVNPYRPAGDNIEEVAENGLCLYLPEGPWDMVTKPASIKHHPTPDMFDAFTEMINATLPKLELGRVNCANVVMHLGNFAGHGAEETLEIYEQYFEEILSPHAETGLIKFATISEAGKLYEETEEKGIAPLPQVVIIVNENYFTDDSEAEVAVSNLRRQAEICEKYSINTEHYFTWFAWKQMKKIDPDYPNWAKEQDFINIHSHGANRKPPSPSLIGRMKGKSWERDYKIAYGVQTHAINLETGKVLDKKGGAEQVLLESGSNIISCGRMAHSVILKVNKDIGFDIAVGLGDNNEAPTNRCFMMNMLCRPDDIFIHPNDEFLPWVNGHFDMKGQLLTEIRELSYFEPQYLLFVIHDWDMFRHVDGDKAWNHYEELIKWLTEEVGCQGTSLEGLYAQANHRKEIKNHWVHLACQELISDIKDNGKLGNYYGSDGRELTLTEIFQGCLKDGDFTPVDFIGPTKLFEQEKELTLDKKSVIEALNEISVEINDWESVPASFEINGETISAGQLLYLACLKKIGELPETITIPAISNYPETTYKRQIPFDRLQFWTFRPAHYSY